MTCRTSTDWVDAMMRRQWSTEVDNVSEEALSRQESRRAESPKAVAAC
jgi:hypothetical protein